MVTTFEKAIQKFIIRARRSVHFTSYLWALCQEFVRSTIHRPVAANGASLPLSEPSGIRTSSECWSLLASSSAAGEEAGGVTVVKSQRAAFMKKPLL
jgi:hypothetical protein